MQGGLLCVLLVFLALKAISSARFELSCSASKTVQLITYFHTCECFIATYHSAEKCEFDLARSIYGLIDPRVRLPTVLSTHSLTHPTARSWNLLKQDFNLSDLVRSWPSATFSSDMVDINSRRLGWTLALCFFGFQLVLSQQGTYAQTFRPPL
jgi:hypothetical protein